LSAPAPLSEPAATAPISLPLFIPPSLAVNARSTTPDNEATLEGKRLHALMERLTVNGQWPIAIPEAKRVARWLMCSESEARIVCEQARRILSRDELKHFFDARLYSSARNEVELVHNGEWMRIDRLVGFEDAVWVLDYKRHLLEQQQADYWQQLARYREACLALFPGKAVYTALITVDGRMWQPDQSNSAH
jgi:ATP-dependent helicase/nuclease subunit A